METGSVLRISEILALIQAGNPEATAAAVILLQELKGGLTSFFRATDKFLCEPDVVALAVKLEDTDNRIFGQFGAYYARHRGVGQLPCQQAMAELRFQTIVDGQKTKT